MTNNGKKIQVVSCSDAQWLELRGRVTVVGHGKFVTDDGKTVKVALVKWNKAEV